MECKSCKSDNPESNKFCGQCGHFLASDPILHAAIQDEIQSRFRDRNVVEVEVAEKVFDRLTKWGKVVLGVLAAALAILGISSYDRLLKNAQDAASAEMSAKIDQASQEFGKKASERVGQLSQEFERNVRKESEGQIHKAASDALLGIQNQVSSETAQLKSQIANSKKKFQELENRVGATCEEIMDFRQCHEKYPTGCSKFGTYDPYLNFLKNLLIPPPSAMSAHLKFLGQQDYRNLEANLPDGLSRGNHADFKDALSRLGEGQSFGLIGFLYYAKPSGVESSNCQLPDNDPPEGTNVDYHIGIGFDPNLAQQAASFPDTSTVPKELLRTLEQNSVIVEMTPHWRFNFEAGSGRSRTSGRRSESRSESWGNCYSTASTWPGHRIAPQP